MPIYSEADIRDIKSAYWWMGAGTGVVGTFLLCLMLGLFVYS